MTRCSTFQGRLAPVTSKRCIPCLWVAALEYPRSRNTWTESLKREWCTRMSMSTVFSSGPGTNSGSPSYRRNIVYGMPSSFRRRTAPVTKACSLDSR